MHGNVSEWVGDCYRDSYGAETSDGSAYTPSSCFAYVLRGGSWNDIVPELRSAEREYPPYGEGRFWMWGFRVARSLGARADAHSEQPRVTWADWPEPTLGSPHPFVSLFMRNPHPPRGHADLDCVVEEAGRAHCTLVREAPAGYGFAEAALSAVELMRAEQTLSDGITPSAGVRTQVTIYFPGPGE